MANVLEIVLLAGSGTCALAACLARLRTYRSLLFGGAALLVITALFPRPGNTLGIYLLGGVSGAPVVSSELFGVAWWLLGAWLVKGLLDLVLRRTLFPNDNQPHARRLFADLASGLIYVVAFVGIMDTVLKQPISAVLATSGVLAIVLGLALQNTLADVFSGLAINIERPFGAGDWITLSDNVEGQIIEINWRATRIRSWANDMIVVPNSIVARSVVTNHGNRRDICLLSTRLTVDGGVPPARVLQALEAAAAKCAGSAPAPPARAYARAVQDSVISYELTVPLPSFAMTPAARSEVIEQIASAMASANISMGAAATEIRVSRADSATAALALATTTATSPGAGSDLR
jgi:small-conductance mechanosensitive channel